MKTIDIDLLIIGDLLCSSDLKCAGNAHLCAGGNKVKIDIHNIPDEIKLYNKRYVLRHAIVIDASKTPVKASNVTVTACKSIFVSGFISCEGAVLEVVSAE